jgi:hypothetical protein
MVRTLITESLKLLDEATSNLGAIKVVPVQFEQILSIWLHGL